MSKNKNTENEGNQINKPPIENQGSEGGAESAEVDDKIFANYTDSASGDSKNLTGSTQSTSVSSDSDITDFEPQDKTVKSPPTSEVKEETDESSYPDPSQKPTSQPAEPLSIHEGSGINSHSSEAPARNAEGFVNTGDNIAGTRVTTYLGQHHGEHAVLMVL